MRKIYIIALVLALLPGCSKTGFWETGSDGNSGCAITFNGKSAPVTKTVSGADAAALLGGSFVVYGSKSNGSSYSTVFDGYNVKWVGANPGETLGNTWEYVGQQTFENHVQDVKYWDYNTQHYTFIAVSRGGGNAIFSDVNPANIGTDSPIYTITGQPNDDQLYPIYLAEPVQVNKANYGKEPVSISFRPFRTKARFGIYETIPGYSVENVTFYHTASIEHIGGTYPVVFTDGDFMPSMGEFEYKIYSSGNDGRLSIQYDAPNGGVHYKSNVAFDTLAYSNDGMLGTTSANPSYFLDSLGNSYIDVLPTGDLGGKLGIRVNFTLVPLDGSDSHKITVRDVIAYIPEEFIRWQPGYAYTYLFKISDAVDGLYPITFDAKEYLANDPLDAETIEGEISITTYQKGSAMEESGVYNTTDNIYVTVGNNAAEYRQLQKTELNANGFVRLFYATGTQKITEKNVQNCILHGNYDRSTDSYSIVDAAGITTLTLTDVSDKMSIQNNYNPGDSPDNEMSDRTKAFACISNPDPGTYIFAYNPDEFSQARYNTLPKGVDCYIYDYKEYPDGNAYFFDYFESDGSEQYDPEITLAKDFSYDFIECLSSPDYYGNGIWTNTSYLVEGRIYYLEDEEANSFTAFNAYFHQSRYENDSYRTLKDYVYMSQYDVEQTIRKGEQYYYNDKNDGINNNTYFVRVADSPIVLSDDPSDEFYCEHYFYTHRLGEKIPAEEAFEPVTNNSSKSLKSSNWYLRIDGLDSYMNDDGTYDDHTSLYIEEYQAYGTESPFSCTWSDGTYGDIYDYGYLNNGLGCYQYMITFYQEGTDYCTLAPGEYVYLDVNKKTMGRFTADGTEEWMGTQELIGTSVLYRVDDLGGTVFKVFNVK